MSERQHSNFEQPPRIYEKSGLGEKWLIPGPHTQYIDDLLEIGIPPIYQNDPLGYTEKVGDLFTFVERMKERL